jgi:catechol 2,3-dioxygenase-like lactoylglutathione lyase family enzyme
LLGTDPRERREPGRDGDGDRGMTRRVAGLAEIVLWVHDMDAALHFYRDGFGLELISPQELPNKFLRAGQGGSGVPEMVVLVPHSDHTAAFPREKTKRVLHHMAFRVDARAYDELQLHFMTEGVEIRTGVHPILKGARTFYVDDPDGNECECISPDPDHKGPMY